jgi:hypothetical protein
MPDLEETIRRLSASFAEEIIAALKGVPLDELIALSDESDGRHDTRPVVASRLQRSRPKRSPSHPTSEALDARVLPDPARETLSASELEAAERIFAERGSRGATAAQLGEVLAAQGISRPDAAADVIRALVEREVIRDAGFRRTTGQGTAPVFVSSR